MDGPVESRAQLLALVRGYRTSQAIYVVTQLGIPGLLWQRLLARPASESGRLRHRDGDHEGGDRCRRAFVLPILQTLSTIISF